MFTHPYRIFVNVLTPSREDADSRVAMLKARMETLKKKREAAKANGKSKPPQTGEPPEKTG